MFPASSTNASSPSRALRRGLVRTLDAAVEFATLGEYGVEEVEIPAAATPAFTWDWPPRCESRARLPRLPRRAPLRGSCGAPSCTC